MMERKLYSEIPGGKNKFHSAVLTTFSFEFHYFEGQVLRTLKEKLITSVNILVDQKMLNESLGVSSNYLKSINQAYAVNGIRSSGAFHPKINFFIGDNSLLAVFGSGNITPGGHGKNHEVFTGFYADSEDDTELPLLLELWEYIINFSKQTEGYSAERICKTIAENCALFSSGEVERHRFHNIREDLDAALLYNDNEGSIYNQLSSLIPATEIEEITVICPYFDEDGALLTLFCQLFPNARLRVYLQKIGGMPPTKMVVDKRITFYDFNKTDRGKGEITGFLDNRRLHAKLFHFKSRTKEYCLVGSANATIAAMGSPDSRPLNEELCVLYASSSSEFLNDLGISKVSSPIENINTLSRQVRRQESIPSSNGRVRHIIKSIDLDGQLLKVYVNLTDHFDESYQLTAFGPDGVKCFLLSIPAGPKTVFEFVLSGEQCDMLPQYCAFVDINGNIVSDKVLINKIDKLMHTNPEKNLRNIREILAKVEAGKFSEFEIADYLNQLYREDPSARKRTMSPSSRSYSNKEVSEKDIPTLSYDEAVSASNDASVLSKIATGHMSSRLWQILEHIFECKSNAVADELMNEEEEASSSESKKRKVDEGASSENPIKTGNDISHALGVVKKISEQYVSDLRRGRYNKDHGIGIVDYLRFLLCSHVITAICHFGEYTSSPNNTGITEGRSRLCALYLDAMRSILREFALLHHELEIMKYDDNQNDLARRQNDLLRKTLYHIILDVSLIYNKMSRHEPVVKEEFILYCLNIFNKCGLPSDGLNDYLERLSSAYGRAFYPPHVLRTLNEIIEAVSKGIYKKTEKLGVIKIVSAQGDKYKIKTIYNEGLSFINKKDVRDLVPLEYYCRQSEILRA